MGVYYNENDPFAAEWLRGLIGAGLLPGGDVDDRSIVDVRAADLRGYRQCHFFAGIGGWPLALRIAKAEGIGGLWSGSCPCQPFSVAGAGKGTADERHLWPAFRDLIAECRPAIVFGEQVASADGRLWLAGVRADLEALGYAVGAADLCAAGIGAPHIRQRLYWVADFGLERAGRSDGRPGESPAAHPGRTPDVVGRPGGDSGLANHDDDGPHRTVGVAAEPGSDGQDGRLHRGSPGGWLADTEDANGWPNDASEREAHWRARPGRSGAPGGLADTERDGRWPDEPERETEGRTAPRWTGAIHPAFADFDLILCGDGKVRRIEPGLPPVAHGVPGRVGKLRGYGNAIVPPLAAEFIQAYREARGK